MDILRVTDARQIYQLLKQFDCVFPHLKEKVDDYGCFAEKLAKYAYVCVVQERKQTCGLLVFYANDDVNKCAYVSLIGVLPQWQGKRVGQQLLDYCFVESSHNGMAKIRLEVDLDNHRAIAFYENHGFVRVTPEMVNSMYMERKL